MTGVSTRRRGAIVGALALLAAHPVAAAPRASGVPSDSRRAAVARAIDEASRRFGVPVDWIWRIINAESGGDPGAVSPAGAIGLMQIMPATYVDLRQRYDLGHDPFAVRDNILAGAAYLRELLDRYGAFGMLAAYNAGPGRWEDYKANGRPLPTETRRYLARLSPAIAPGAVDATPPQLGAPRPSPFASPIFVAPATVTLLVAGSLPRAPAAADAALEDAGTVAPDSTSLAKGARSAAPVHDALPAPFPRSGGLFIARQLQGGSQ